MTEDGSKGQKITRNLSDLAGSLRSANILILKYSNKMAIEYYLYSYLGHFPSTNIFGYSFVDF